MSLVKVLTAASKDVVAEGLGAVRRPVMKHRFRQAIAVADGSDRNISVGSGNVDLPGWISTDIVWWAERYLDLLKPWPVQAGTVSRVYADNVIEHFPIENVAVVLRNIFSALRPGGVLRLATPDLEKTARAYLDDPDLTKAHLERHARKGFKVRYPADLLRVTYCYHGHHLGYIFDEASLSAELLTAGFTKVVRCAAGESSRPELVGLERRDEPTEDATGLILEAEKPDC